MSSEGLLAVTDWGKCVHLLTRDGTLVRSIGEGVLGGWLFGLAFDLKGNLWVTDSVNRRIVKMSQDGRLLQTILHASSKGDPFSHPLGVTVSQEGLIYISDSHSHRVTVHDEEGKFLFVFGTVGSGPGCFDGPRDITFGSDGLVYVTDDVNNRVCVWSKKGSFKRHFETKYGQNCIAATSGNHLLVTSYASNTVMVYTLDGKLVHEFGGKGSHAGRLEQPCGICIGSRGLVYVVDSGNKRVLVF